MTPWFALACVPPMEVEDPPRDDTAPTNDTAPPPAWIQVFSVSPLQVSASGGDLLVITGSGFSEGVQVSIGGQAATVGAVTPETIGVVAPPGEVGLAELVVSQGEASVTVPDAVEYMFDFAGATVMSVWGWIREEPPSGFDAQDWSAYFDEAWTGSPLFHGSDDAEPDTPLGLDTPDTCAYLISPGLRADFRVPYLDVGAPGSSLRLPFVREWNVYQSKTGMGGTGVVGQPVEVSWVSGAVPAADRLEVGVFPDKAPRITRPIPDERVGLGAPLVVEWESLGGGPMELVFGALTYPTILCVVEDDGHFEIPLELNPDLALTTEEQTLYLELGAVNWSEVTQPVSNAVIQTHLTVGSTVSLIGVPTGP